MEKKGVKREHTIRDTPEGKLWGAVLKKAIQDAIWRHKNNREYHDKIDALVWMFSPRKHFGSFESVCGLLDRSADKIRQRISEIMWEKKQNRNNFMIRNKIEKWRKKDEIIN